MKYSISSVALLLVLVCSFARASDQTENVGENLPPRLRALLIQEMNALSEAMNRILDGLIRGQDEVVATNANAIFDSFILKKEMTESDREVLRTSVPEDFVKADQRFHELSKALAEAARAGDRSGQVSLFADMVETCRQCHGRYAADRFPELR